MDTYNQQPYQNVAPQQFVTNSSADEMDALLRDNAEDTSVKNKFDEKRYLNTKLDDGVTKRTTYIRLLPITANSTKMFAQAKTHSLKVPTQIAKSGFKSYICLDDPNIPGYDLNIKCPICAKSRELFNKAREYNPKDIEEKVKALTVQMNQYQASGDVNMVNQIYNQIIEVQKKADPTISKSIFKEACNLKPKVTYFSRVIERGKENEGVKWWRFNENSEHNGIRDHLINHYIQLQEEMRMAGIDDRYNVFDLNNGRDFVLNFAQKDETDKNGKSRKRTSIQVSVSSIPTPLTKDVELGNKWLTDPMTWSDCYAIKGADYLSVIVEGKIPRQDKATGVWYGVEPYATGVQQTAQMVQQTQQSTVQYAAPAQGYQQTIQ